MSRTPSPLEDTYIHLAPAGANGVVLDCAERCRIYANRLQFSTQYTYLYVAVILLNAMLLLWTVVEADYPLGHVVKFWVFVVADSLVTLFVLFEIVVSLLAQGSRLYFSLWHNRVDILIALLCIFALLGHLFGPAAELELEEDLESAVVVARYVAQLARLVMLVKNYRRQVRVTKALDVHLDLATNDSDANMFDDVGMPSPRASESTGGVFSLSPHSSAPSDFAPAPSHFAPARATEQLIQVQLQQHGHVLLPGNGPIAVSTTFAVDTGIGSCVHTAGRAEPNSGGT
mmetsp:Transcript_45379/g.96549  ORF Transcript_45379/g.96549 Transcript_45379/m.96549 type:complete len:287 (-) Transcript_45379:662-1522(-)